MTITEFWNQAFLAALTRIPADEAKTEADKATELCIGHWEAVRGQTIRKELAWKDQAIDGSNVRASHTPTSKS